MKTLLQLYAFCSMLAIFSAMSCLAEDRRAEEINTLIADFNSTDITQRINAAKIVTRSGFRSLDLYTTIESLLKDGYNSSSKSKHIDEMSWLCKALAASGDHSYAGLLNEVADKADSSKLRKYARQSANRIGEYAKRQELMNRKDTWDKRLTDDENRYISMLKSDDQAINRDAAKLIYRNRGLDRIVYDTVEQRILEKLPDASASTLHSDCIAWLCKALSGSGQRKYIPTLEKVIASTENATLRRHAKKALNTLK